MRGVLFLLAAAGCSGGGAATDPPTDTATDGATDSPTPTADACPADLPPDPAQVCFETDAPEETTGGTSTYVISESGSVAATIADVGGGASLPGSRAVAGFTRCAATFERGMRLVDADGYTWQLGWQLASDADATSADALKVGDELTLSWLYERQSYSADFQVLLADGDVPRWFFAFRSYLDHEALGALAVSAGEDTCRWVDPAAPNQSYIELPVVFEAQGAVTLYSGQGGIIDVSDQAVHVVVPSSFEIEDCADGCTGSWFVGWQ